MVNIWSRSKRDHKTMRQTYHENWTLFQIDLIYLFIFACNGKEITKIYILKFTYFTLPLQGIRDGGGSQLQGGGVTNLLFGQNYMKIKKIGLREGKGCIPCASRPATVQRK